MKRGVWVAGLALSLAVLAGCGGKDKPPLTPDPDTVPDLDAAVDTPPTASNATAAVPATGGK